MKASENKAPLGNLSEEDLNIREYILSHKHPSYTTTSKKEVRVRCPYCGDSTKNPTSAHLYIEMKPPFRFHCFKCETSGVLNQQTMRDLGLSDDKLSISVINANKEYKKGVGFTRISMSKQKLKNTPCDTEASQRAVKYFNSRYNSNYTNEELVSKFKCVTDATKFFAENNIFRKNPGFDFTNAIGFISSDNSYVIFRDITGQQEHRYCNLNLVPDTSIGIESKAYTISSDIDVLSEEVTLIITEGIFDIIGIYTHFFKDRDNKNVIFAAACGKSYMAVILNYIRMGFLNLKVVIFSNHK